MKNGAVAAWSERVHMALGKSADTVTRRGPGRWSLTLTNGEVLRTRAWASDEWLQLDAAIRGRRRRDQRDDEWPWTCLMLNATLPGGAKYAIDSRGGLRIRAEVPLISDAEDIDLCRRVADVCEALKAASTRLHGGAVAKQEPPAEVVRTNNGDAPVCDLRRLCEESGWAFTERAGERLAVELEVPDGFHQAIVEPRSDGVRVVAQLGSYALPSAVSRRAVGVMLLTLGAVLRMARPAGADRDGAVTTWLEASLPVCPIPAELAHALSAVSIGCEMCAREVDVLQDESVAKEFLTVRGWSS
jgi:hypothetical protein